MGKNFFKSFLFLFYFFSITFVFADNKTEKSFFKDYNSKIWTVADGLPGNSITDIIQSHDGYIYMGSYEGLVRFDGFQFSVFKRNTDDRFSFTSARSIFEDSKHNIWIGANDEGITCARTDGSVVAYDTKNGLPNNSVRAICEDKSGRIWVGTSSGISCIADGLIQAPAGIDLLPKENTYLIKDIFCDSEGIVWVIMEDTGEAFYYKDGSFNSIGAFSSIKESTVTAICQDEDGSMWFGVAPYYAINVDIKNRTEKIYNLGFGNRKATVVSNIFQDSEKKIWFSLDNGIAIKNGSDISFASQEDGLADEKVTKIIEDAEHNIWIATDRGGVQKYSRSKFNILETNSTVNAICEDTYRNCIWLASDDGLYCYENDEFVTNKITDYFKNVRIRHVELTKDKKLLVSAYAKLGQSVVYPDGKIESWKKETGLAGNKVRVAIQHSNGDIYAGTTTGLSIITTQDVIVEIKKEIGIKNDYIMFLYEDTDGSVWCGTDGGGIFILKDYKLLKTITTDDGLAGNVIFKISRVRDDEIWVTTGTGLSVIKNGKFYNFDSTNGLGIDSVFQAINDGKGKIWFTSNKGIFSINNEFFDAGIAGVKASVEPKFYSVSDGIKSSGVTSTSLSIQDTKGNIWFTMVDGVAKYNMGLAKSKNSAPIVHIEEIMLDSKRIRFTGKPVEIDSSVNRVSIKYTGLCYSAPDQIMFKTRLDGFESEYTDWTSDRIVSYTNLSPKNYKFFITALSGDEIEGECQETLVLVKKPAVWQRVWFWILVALVFGMLMYKIIQTRINYVNQERDKVRQLSVEVTMALAGTIDAKDTYTNGHSRRVAEYSRLIAASMGKTEEEQDNIYYIAILHDIGKIGIPDTIINKPGKLTDEEFKMIKKHPEIGSEILQSIKSMPEVSVGARWHHERYDGKGYPDGLKGELIPEIARIICVADSYDAMTSNRSYRKYLPQDVVREELVKNKGTQFDPDIADKMIELIDNDKEYLMHE